MAYHSYLTSSMKRTLKELIEDMEDKFNCIIFPFFNDKYNCYSISIYFKESGKILYDMCTSDNEDDFELSIIKYFNDLQKLHPRHRAIKRPRY